MKTKDNSIFRIGILLVVFVFSGTFGCKELDEIPPGILNPDTYFETQEDALTALTGAYAGAYGGAQRYYLKSWIVIVDVGSDDMSDGFGGIQERKELDRFKFDPAFGDFYHVWWSAYIMINRAGNVIENVPKMPASAFDSPELQKRIVAEARFLRAQNYFNLVRLWGDVVFHGDSYVSDPVGDADLERTDVETIYDFIIEELELAEQDLWNREEMEKGRTTRGAAQAFLSKVYLTRAGWRLDAKTNTMVQGDPSNWAKAAQWAKKCIDEGHYGLRENYRDVFPAHEDDYDQYENNEEHIFFVNCIEAGPWFETKLYWGPRMANGEGGYSSFVGEKELIYSLEPGDLRDDVINLYYIIDELEEEQPLDESNADYWWAGMAFPHTNKYLPDEDKYDFPPSGNASGTNYPLFRFPEVLLIYAEAVNEQGGPTAEAIEAFNRVRRRAGLSEWPNVNDLDGNPYPDNQEGFRQAIRQERRWELCYEGKRLFDLRRWGNLVETFQARVTAPDATPQDQIRAQNIELKHNLYPIPFGEIQKNPNLTQNPGY
ncbi:MAG: RagB/SusD family nutrient uptake outer membrane protein [Bacteroidales bacterium]